MTLFQAILAALGGFVLLTVSSEFLLRGSVILAVRLGMSPLFIGLTLVAFATSAPELVVSIDAVLRAVPGLALGNAIGSNIANILLVLGVMACITPLAIERKRIRNDMIVVLLSALWLLGLVQFGVIPRVLGGASLIFLTIYIVYSYIHAKREGLVQSDIEISKNMRNLPPIIVLGIIVLAGVGLAFGAEFLVKGASSLAGHMGISEAVIGLSVVAIGTSLPELAVCIAAARRKQIGLAIGNVLGSNIANILLVLGGAAFIHPINVDARFAAYDIWIMLGATIIMIFLLSRAAPVKRLIGIGFLILYAVYIYNL